MQLVRRYLDCPLAWPRLPSQQGLLLAVAFLLVAGSVVAVHLMLPGPQPAGLVLAHALHVAVAYTLALALLGWLLQLLRRRGAARELRVWHLWSLSLACYVLGFAVHALHDDLTVTLHQDVDAGGELHHFLRLLPLWAIVTAVLIQPCVLHGQGIGREGARLRLELGRKRIDLPATAISHIVVDDHHCYLHHVRDGTLRKIDLGLPLKELLGHLPEQFLQIHRSHVVNVDAVSHVSRQDRQYRVHLRDGDVVLPISRQRMQAVLPILEGHRS